MAELDIERLKELRKAAWPMKLDVSRHGDATCVTDGHICLVHDLSPEWAAFITEAANQMDAILARLAEADRMEEAARTYFARYCQDEAARDGALITGCSEQQHEDARRLAQVLGIDPDTQVAATLNNGDQT